MRDIETLRRSILRRSRLYKGKSSWPLISGDTYRSLCGLKFESLNDLVNIKSLDGFSGNVFVSAGIASDFFMALEKSQSMEFSEVKLVIHNGDLIPGIEVFNRWNLKFKEISTVNWLSQLDRVRPIPIGLENWSYMRNGVPKDFLNQNSKVKDIELLVSFNDCTNPDERTLAREVAKKIPGAYIVSNGTSPKQYRGLVKRSSFVLSPPGNGADCHRTWEAIYLGAVPIVKSKFWPFNGYALPALVLQDWEELPDSIGKYLGIRNMTSLDLNSMFLGRVSNEI